MQVIGFLFNVSDWDYNGLSGLTETRDAVINAISDKTDDYFCVYPDFTLIDYGETIAKISNNSLVCDNFRNAVIKLISSFNDIDDDIYKVIFVINNQECGLDDHTVKICDKISRYYTKVHFISIIRPVLNFTCINNIQDVYSLIVKETKDDQLYD